VIYYDLEFVCECDYEIRIASYVNHSTFPTGVNYKDTYAPIIYIQYISITDTATCC